MTNPISSFNSYLSAKNSTPAFLDQNDASRPKKMDPGPPGNNWGLQAGGLSASLRDNFRASLEQNQLVSNKSAFKVSSEQFHMASNPQSLHEYYEDAIEHHVNFRVNLFFQQAIACYNTNVHYESTNTNGQFFQAKNLRLIDAWGNQKDIPFDAAHSATIPTLKYCSLESYKFDFGPLFTPDYYTFLEDSHFENMHNSTNSLPKFVNIIDNMIDGKGKNARSLRPFTVFLINELAQCKLTPQDATRHFLVELDRMICEKSFQNNLNEEKRLVLAHYHEAVQGMIQEANLSSNDPHAHLFFDRLMDVNLSKDRLEETDLIRRLVYSRKYQLIQEGFFTETKIHRIIDRYLPYEDRQQRHRIRCAVLYYAGLNEDLKTVLEKLFCVSYPILKSDWKAMQEIGREFSRELDIFILNLKFYFDNALRDIRVAVQNFRTLEQDYQEALIRDFQMQLRNWSDGEFDHKLSQQIAQTIIREKNKPQPNWQKIQEVNSLHFSPNSGHRPNQRLKRSHIKVIAKTLKVNPDHFFGSFFASDAHLSGR